MTEYLTHEKHGSGTVSYMKKHECRLPPIGFPVGATFVCDTCRATYRLETSEEYEKYRVGYPTYWKPA